MSEQDEDPYEGVARWLKELGLRRGTPRLTRDPSTGRGTESSESLLRWLESEAGRPLRSREDIHAFLRDVAADDPEATRASRRRRIVREGLLLGFLVAAFLQFYFLDIQLQIGTLRSLVVYLPP